MPAASVLSIKHGIVPLIKWLQLKNIIRENRSQNPRTREVLIYSNKREEEYKKGKERFLNEARTVAKFNTHPNIANVYDFFEDNNTAYMVMDYMEGMSYKEFIHDHNGIVDIKTAIQVSLAVLDALKEVT